MDVSHEKAAMKRHSGAFRPSRSRLPRQSRLLFDLLEARILLTTWYVDINSPGPTRDGTSWSTAYSSPQSALTVAIGGDEIHVADGTYTPTYTTDRNATFQLKNSVALLGGYGGYGDPNPDARNVALYRPVLSGDIGTVGVATDNSLHVVTSSGVNSATVLEGFTISGGYATGSIPTNSGAGMRNTGGSPTIRDCIFTGNAAATTPGGVGGAMYNLSASPLVIGCVFSGNSAANAGGAIYNSSSPGVSLINCIFVGNTVGNGGGGGGVYNSASDTLIEGCTFAANVAVGGSLYNVSCTPTVRNSILWDVASPIVNSNSNPAISYSDVRGGNAGVGNINADPQFVRAPWAGPDATFTTADDDLGDLRLRAGSPALNIGSNAGIPAGITTDLAGNARIQDGTVDLGAYEGAVSVSARILYVDSHATGASSGLSWSDAFVTLQSALAAAVDGDTIRIAQGVYKPTTTTDRSAGFALRNGVAIVGGFAGSGSPSPGDYNPGIYPTMLSGDIGSASKTDNSYHVLTAVGLTASGAVDGLTVAFGNANGVTSKGGGLYVAGGAAPTITNCFFEGNFAGGGGAIYFLYAGAPLISNCIFVGNNASAIYSDHTSPKITNCTFAANVNPIYGGSLYDFVSSVNVSNCILWDGTVAVKDIDGTTTVTNSDIKDGYAGTGNISAVPQFVRSPWAGPDGDFGTMDDDFGDLRLRTGSPAAGFGAFTGTVVSPAAKTIYVDVGSTGLNTGVSWTDAFASLQSALQAAVDGDTICVAAGVYKPTPGTNPNIGFALRNSVAVLGGYAGHAGADPGARDIRLYTTVLSGDIGVSGNSSDNSYHVLTARCVDISSRLDGVTVTAGMANGINGPDLTNADSGAGMYNLAASPTIENCTFTANSAVSGGGAIYNRIYSSPVISGTTFAANSGGTGAGISNYWYSSPAIMGSTFTGNAGGSGGAISCVFYSAPAVTNSTFTGNSATGDPTSKGGVAYFQSSTGSTWVNCTFIKNSASVYGAAIALFQSGTSIVNCTFAANSGGTGGAIYSGNSSAVTVANSILWGNTSGPIAKDTSSSASVSYSDVQGGFNGPNKNVDPQFIRNPVGNDYGDLRLNPTSPCIDAGNNSAPGLAAFAADLAGRPRFIDVPTTPDSGSGFAPMVDVGAYEANTISLFYRNSAFDTSDPAAIALDKIPLLPGGTATFANYSSFDRGINGIILDVPGNRPNITAADFTFRVGNDNSPDVWPAGAAPVSVTAVAGDTTTTWTRVTIVWGDHAIQGEWLQAVLASNGNTGLAAPLIFYFGNAPGESGNSPTEAKVNATDQLGARFAASSSAFITSRFDYNRDGVINAADELVAAQNYTWFENELRLISPTAGAGSAVAGDADGPISASLASRLIAVPTTSVTATAQGSVYRVASLPAADGTLGLARWIWPSLSGASERPLLQRIRATLIRIPMVRPHR
jgi:hypothetical protein